MTSAIMAVTPSRPKSIEELTANIQYFTAPDVALALEQAKRHVDIGRVVTVRERFIQGDLDDPSRAIYQSIDDSPFQKLGNDVAAEAPRWGFKFRHNGGPLLLLNFVEAQRVHWMRRQTRGRENIYPQTCVAHDDSFAPGVRCPVCQRWPESRVVGQGSALVFDDNGDLQALRVSGAAIPQMHAIYESMGSDFACTPIRYRKHHLYGRTQTTVEELPPTSTNFDNIIDGIDFAETARRLPFLLLPVRSTVFPVSDDAMPDRVGGPTEGLSFR
jgi:hypothetical protein